MKAYLPQWKIYLWEKLLLAQDDPKEIYHPGDFVYFDSEDKYGALIAQSNRDMRKINTIRLGGTATATDYSLDTTSDVYYSTARDAMLALIELAEEDPACLVISDIKLHKLAINNYRQQRKKYLASEERKRLAGMISGGVHVSRDDKRYTDRFCGLPEAIYKKVEAEESLTLTDLASLIRNAHDESLHSLLFFKIQVEKKNLLARMEAYIDDFIAGNLIPPKGVRYFKFDEQKNVIFDALQSLSAKYGNTIVTTFAEVAEHGGWADKDERHYRFYETLLALEKMKEIEIRDLRKEEVPPTKEISSADKKRLFILEKLKEEWDLAAEGSSGHGHLSYYGKSSRIPSVRFNKWLSECGIDFYQFQEILATFKQEDLILNSDHHHDYE
jgi:hypothetical protein